MSFSPGCREHAIYRERFDAKKDGRKNMYIPSKVRWLRCFKRKEKLVLSTIKGNSIGKQLENNSEQIYKDTGDHCN